MMVNAQGQVNFVGEALLAGSYSGMRPVPGGLEAASSPAHWAGRYDSGQANTAFGRLKLLGSLGSARFEVLAASAEAPVFELDSMLALGAPISEKREAMLALRHASWSGASDVLLSSVPGRVLYLLVSVWPEEGAEAPVLEGLELQAPWQPFTSYLPEIYSGNPFFDRFIAVFQSAYLDLEEQVDAFPRELDFCSASPASLRMLASWLGIDDPLGLYSEAQLRQVVAAASLLQAAKGTRGALIASIKLLCGAEPRVIEHLEWAGPELPDASRALYGKLYGQGPDDFTVLIPCEPGSRAEADEAGLRWLIDQNTPLGAHAQLVVLGPASHIDTHCYLDVNCTINTPALAKANQGQLDGDVALA
jgi:phage tail-like protein